MTPLIRKEIRLLLPFFGIALFLAAAASWTISEQSVTSSGTQSVFWIFGFGMVLLGLAPFGQEFGLGTFSGLLAQPAQRNRIWITKLILILAAAALALLVLVVSIHLRLDSLLRAVTERLAYNHGYRVWDLNVQKSLVTELSSHQFWWIGLATGAVGLSGGLWAALLFRQLGAALWFALLVPAVFFICVEWFIPGDSARVMVSLAGAAAYSIAGLFWAHRLFLRVQDVQWLGDTISPFGLRSASARTASAGSRRRRSLRALVRKEIQSHQISYLIGFGLLVLHVCTLAFRRFHTFPSNSRDLRFALESVPFLWFLLPWLIGSVAVAEERKLGVVEAQFCVPVSRLLQYVIKFAIVLLLGVTLGGLMPCLLEACGASLGVSGGVTESHFIFGSNEFFGFTRGAAILAATLAGISFFASTLTRNTLHALGAGIVFTGALCVLFGWVSRESWSGHDYSLWNGPLIFLIGIPVLIIVALWLSWSNYKLLHAGRNAWLRNALVLGASLFLAGMATAVTYQRPWELLMSVEPKHGPARLSGPVRPAVCVSDERVVALLPDGRLWAAMDYQWHETELYTEEVDTLGHTNRVRLRKRFPNAGQLVEGSNWVSVAAIRGEVVALKSDGSLWQILSLTDKAKSFDPNFWLGRGREVWRIRQDLWFSLAPEPRRIGSDNDWKSVVGGGTHGSQLFTALKTDGTAWHWGWVAEDSSGIVRHLEQPMRLGTNSDWDAIFSERYDVLFMKRDGEIWTRDYVNRGHYEFKRSNLNGSDWLAVAGNENARLYLHKDGTLWGAGFLPKFVFDTRTRSPELHRISDDSRWNQIVDSPWNTVGIKKDGKLVESNLELFSSVWGQPSRNSDWLATGSDWDDLAALAADGTVSFWFPRGESWSSMLGPTHRPRWSLNVLDDTR